ncbi:LamB/YcsF family protein [Gordonia sp. 'Campus']|uniref:LamB/YcsF family protein n=1 Tax=Gordonia sp. 'Campus' TaxID=2915824 RepID=UPI001EE46142|nr:5-oxoprolinase subunit PxpA [Gordonia sp. 'Campus']
MDSGGGLIDLNADLGEGVGDDAAMLEIVTSANVACGFHAGTPTDLHETCRAAVAAGVRIGAQVSYPDRSGFGRRFMEMTTSDLIADLVYQIGALDALARSVGGRVAYVKPHGALYNTVVRHEQQADAVVAAIRDVDAGLSVMGLPGSEVLARARRAGLATVTEAFADRAYTPQGTLVPRAETGAVLSDTAEIARRVVELVTTGRIAAIDGTSIGVEAQSVCLHGDTPGAVHHAQAVRAALTDAGFAIGAPG